MNIFKNLKVINEGSGLASGTINTIKPLLAVPSEERITKARKQAKSFEQAVLDVKDLLLKLKSLNNDSRYDEPLLLLEKTTFKKEVVRLIKKDKELTTSAIVLISDRFKTIFASSQNGDVKHKQDMVSFVEFLLLEQIDPSLVNVQKSNSLDSIFWANELNIFVCYLINKFDAKGIILNKADENTKLVGINLSMPIISLEDDSQEIDLLKAGQDVTIQTKPMPAIAINLQNSVNADSNVLTPIADSTNLNPIMISTYLSNVLKPISNGTNLVINTNKLFLEQAPSVAVQTRAYKSVINKNPDNELSFILFNVDTLNKPNWLDYGNYVSDLLVKGIRLAYVDQKIFSDQITAILQASQHTDKEVTIMLPMVSTNEEYLVLQNAVDSIAKTLVNKGKKIGNVKTSVMLETPSLALDMEIILRNTDKVILDLDEMTQYLMGIEKNNQLFKHLYQPLNPVILKFVQSVLQHAKAFNTKVYIQGRSVNEPEVLVALIGLGAKNITVSRYFTDEAKKLVKKYNNQEVINLIEKVKNYKTVRDVQHDIEVYIDQNISQ